MTNAVTIASLGSSNTTWGFKNRLINGDMRVSQRGSVNVTAAGGSTYTAADRFNLVNYFGSGNIQTALSTSLVPNGYAYSLQLTVGTAPPLSGTTGYYTGLAQTIEGYNISDCYNGYVTLSFWVRSSIAGTYSVAFMNSTSIAQNANTRIYIANYTISGAGVWDKGNNTGLTVMWNLGAEGVRKGNTYLNTWGTMGSTYQYQSLSQTQWAATAGATFNIAGTQLEPGSAATSFDNRDYQSEYSRCCRYFHKSSPYAFLFPINGIVYRQVLPPTSVPMRANASVVVYHPADGTVNQAREHSSGTARNVSSVSSTQVAGGIQSTLYAELSTTPAYNVQATVTWDAEL